jgi:ABC-type sugar transport system ATPase subunit
MSSDLMLEVKNITMNFGTINALKNVTFSIPKGQVLGLVGDNNAGRTTMLNILSGAVEPTSGEFWLDGERSRFKSPADAFKSGVAIVHQFIKVVDIASIWENFFMGRELTKRTGPFKMLDIEKMKSATQNTVSKYGHGFSIDREIKNLSGGQRQIIAVTRAIDTNPKLLLLDEPYHGLSKRVINDIFQILREARETRGTSIIITTQWYEQISGFVDEVMVMRMGEVMGKFNAADADGGHIFKLSMGLAC